MVCGCCSPALEDERAFREWLERLAALPVTQIVVAHGACALTDGRIALRNAIDALERRS
jgi:Ni,Fe-hydrogenase III small subunit